MKGWLPAGVSRNHLILLLLASFQVLFGLATLLCNQPIFQSIIQSQLVIQEGTKSYVSWVATPFPIYIEVYFFNMLNHEAFEKHGDAPVMEEKGPYTFRQEERKVDLEWHPDSTVSYQRSKLWFFERERSVGPLEDTVVSLNLPMVAAANFARDDFLKAYGMSEILSTIEAQLFVNKTIGELLFDGYEDPVLQIASFNEEEEDEFDMFGEEEEKNEPEPFAIPMDKFGWFYKRNGTTWSDGHLRMHTGQGDIEKLGQIVSWNKSNRTEAFEGACGEVRGSADGLFAPGLLERAESFTLWSTDACRKLTFSRVEEGEVSGVTVTKFQMDDQVFDNGTQCEGNSCYENNLPSGVQNVTQCKGTSPAYLSRPHFYKADSSYAEQLQTGMRPDPERHESYFMIEPQTSIPVKVQMALQLNVKLEPIPDMEYVFKSLPTVYLPIFWFHSSAALPENMAAPLLILLNLPNILMISSGCSIVVGLLILAIICQRVRRTRVLPQLVPTTEPPILKTTDLLEEKSCLQTDF